MLISCPEQVGIGILQSKCCHPELVEGRT